MSRFVVPVDALVCPTLEAGGYKPLLERLTQLLPQIVTFESCGASIQLELDPQDFFLGHLGYTAHADSQAVKRTHDVRLGGQPHARTIDLQTDGEAIFFRNLDDVDDDEVDGAVWGAYAAQLLKDFNGAHPELEPLLAAVATLEYTGHQVMMGEVADQTILTGVGRSRRSREPATRRLLAAPVPPLDPR